MTLMGRFGTVSLNNLHSFLCPLFGVEQPFACPTFYDGCVSLAASHERPLPGDPNN